MQQLTPSDQSLMAAIVRRDERALKTLYERYSALIFTFALRRLNDRGGAEEVLQDVFLRCWEQAASYRSEAGGVPAWLFGITRNRAIDVSRSRSVRARQREQQELPGGDTLEEPGQADESDALILQLTVVAALRELPAAQRQAIALAYYGDLSQSEIARRLGEPLGTVKTRIRTAMERLRQSLRPVLEQDAATKATGLHD